MGGDRNAGQNDQALKRCESVPAVKSQPRKAEWRPRPCSETRLVFYSCKSPPITLWNSLPRSMARVAKAAFPAFCRRKFRDLIPLHAGDGLDDHLGDPHAACHFKRL